MRITYVLQLTLEFYGRKERKNIMWYRAGKVSRNAISVLVIYTIVYAVVSVIVKDWTATEQMLPIILLIEGYPLEEIQRYQTFGYSRKKLFSYCIFEEVIRAFLYGGIYRTIMQVLFYSNYVKYYTEDTPEAVSRYHQCPVWELFLVNIAIFFFIRLIIVFDSTRKYPIFHFSVALKKGKKPVMPRWRKWIRVIEFPVLFIGVVVFVVSAVSSYDFMLRNTIEDKIGIYLAVLAGIIIFLVVLWNRFQSENTERLGR